MRLAGLLLALLTLAAVGCTTRTDKEKNKDFDQPRSTSSGRG